MEFPGGDDVVIRVDGLSKRYGAFVAVDDVSFSVQRGEIFGILGPNGAGKTTTLSCLEGLVDPSSGSATVLGMDVGRDSANIKERIGVQLQASAYFDYLTLLEILRLFGGFYRQMASPEELLKRVDLLDRANTNVGKLSGGQQQRFTIAAALINNPDLVFLDEPTTGLDPQARRNLWEFVQSMKEEGRTVVLTTHYMEEAEYLCDRVAIMDNGKVIALDTPAMLISQLPIPYEIRFTAAAVGERAADLDGLPGVVAVKQDGEDLYRLSCTDASAAVAALTEWAKAAGLSFAHLEVVASNLEDVFLATTGHELRE